MGWFTSSIPAAPEIVLYTFTGGADGGFPYGNITLDVAGNLYGTTYSGGGASGAGVVFKLDPSGNETVLFNGGGNGSSDFRSPTSGVIFDAAGNLYGTTYNGDSVYKLEPAGNESVLYAFGSGPNDGINPWAGVIFDAAGNIHMGPP